jgi:hypothetical protein
LNLNLLDAYTRWSNNYLSFVSCTYNSFTPGSSDFAQLGLGSKSKTVSAQQQASQTKGTANLKSSQSVADEAKENQEELN